MFTRSKAKLASTLEPEKVLESLQISDGASGNAISHGGPESTQNSVSLSHTCSTQNAQVVSDKEYLGSDHGPQTLDSPLNKVPTMDTEQVAKLLSDHTKELATHWDAQLATLTNALKLSNQTPSFPASNSVPLPKFSGDGSEDVNEFLANFERTARFYELNEDRKAETFPLSLTGNANVWFNTTPGLSGKNFEYLATALKTQFHSDSDVWLLRQKLNERKQLPSETVSEFAAAIRRLAQRINLPPSECINYFIQGLRPDLKNFVILQRPKSFEEAEMHAKLKESVPDPKPADRTDEILKALAQLQEKTAPKPKSTIAAADRYHPFTDKAAGESRPVTREEVSQIVSQVIRQELRGQNSRHANYQNTRGRRSFLGQPICDFCNRSGHVLATCRQRMRQMQGQTPSSRDPRIPNFNRPPQTNSNWGGPNYTPRTQTQPHLN